VIVRVENLGKRYKIYRHSSLRLLDLVVPIGRRYRSFWALRNVSFHVEEGDALAILGANGAGKSTLLRVIAGASRPTEGTAEINGRVAAVLELGVGFHPEMTGRHNILLNGLLMGMMASEIDERTDEIIGFAALGDFIDRPVREYSSGMRSRLGFSIASHTSANVLLVDEALSVGDTVFRIRASERMHQLVSSGVTLLYTSHSAKRCREICNKGLWLDHGQVLEYGDIDSVTAAYELRGKRVAYSGPGVVLSGRDEKSRGEIPLALMDVSLRDAVGDESREVEPGAPIEVQIGVYASQRFEGLNARIRLVGEDEAQNMEWLLAQSHPLGLELESGYHRLTARMSAPSVPGTYTVTVQLGRATLVPMGRKFFLSRLFPSWLRVVDVRASAAGPPPCSWRLRAASADELEQLLPCSLDACDPRAPEFFRNGWRLSDGIARMVADGELYVYLRPGATQIDVACESGLWERSVAELKASSASHRGEVLRLTNRGDRVFAGRIPDGWAGQVHLLILSAYDARGRRASLNRGRELAVRSVTQTVEPAYAEAVAYCAA
jgi:ABC-type polysaccharide/polyol phosphate transport system ATPase subunit